LAGKCLFELIFGGFGGFDHLKLWYRSSNPKGMQLLQKHQFWYITRQNWSSSWAPSWAKE